MRWRVREPAALSRTINQLKCGPSLSGSIVITVFEDAIAPRGGLVWLGEGGMCPTCRVRLVGGKAELDIDYSFVGARAAASFSPARRVVVVEVEVVDYDHG